MRKRRAILYDDDLVVLKMLKMFFELRGYEVIACREPVRCPVYDDRHRCGNVSPCADIILADHRMPRMTGFELVKAQAEMGCRLAARNKAIVSGCFDSVLLERARELGCTAFRKPVTFEQLDAWLDDREQGMDLSRPLGFKRKEDRRECWYKVNYQLEEEDEVLQAVLVNRSDSGLCIRVRRPPEVRQVVNVISGTVEPSPRLEVRWIRFAGEGSYLVGMGSS